MPCPRRPPPLPQVSAQPLGEYLKANIFAPANLAGAVYVPGSGGGAPSALLENLVNNPGYVSLFNVSAGERGASGS